MYYEDDYSFSRNMMEAGEQILWRGKPEPGNLFSPSDIFTIPFSILWCGFAIYWEYAAICSMGFGLFSLFGIPFVLMGLYITVGRFILTAYNRKRTLYVITDRKIIRRRRAKADMVHATTLPPMSTHVHRNGNYTISFIYQTQYYNARRSGTAIGASQAFRLENIADGLGAQAAIHRMMKDDNTL